MNPLTNTRNITKLSQRELSLKSGKGSWHDEYKESAWIFIGGLPYDLSEGDIIAIFSQYGEIVNINLVRDKVSGKQKGFAFLCYEDQRSTVLAVDNFNGIKILSRTIRVDHVKDYKPPKDSDKYDDETRKLMEEGCAPKAQPAASSSTSRFEDDEQLLDYTPDPSLKQIKSEPESSHRSSKRHKESKKRKKEKKKSKKSKHKSKKRRRNSSSESSSENSS